MKVLADYNNSTGVITLTDAAGVSWTSTTAIGLKVKDYGEKLGADKLIELREAGYTTDEIMKLQKKGLL